MDRIDFGLVQVEKLGDVSLRNYQCVPVGYWIAITDCEAQLIFSCHALRVNLAKHAVYIALP